MNQLTLMDIFDAAREGGTVIENRHFKLMRQDRRRWSGQSSVHDLNQGARPPSVSRYKIVKPAAQALRVAIKIMGGEASFRGPLPRMKCGGVPPIPAAPFDKESLS